MFSFFQYNQEDADEYKCAVRLEKYFDKELSRVGLVDETQFPKVKISENTGWIQIWFDLNFCGFQVPKSKKRRAWGNEMITDMEYRNRKF